MAKLYFRYAAMNAGKTTQLLQTAYNYKESLGLKVLLLTSALDTRNGVGVISARIGLQAEAEAIPVDSDLFERITCFLEAEGSQAAVVLVDEAQFLAPEQVRQLHRAASCLDIPVICYGLRSDFQGNPFPGAAMLLTLAEDLEEVKTMCSCRSKATMNIRMNADGSRAFSGDQVEVGDKSYKQACARCFYS